MIRQVAVKRLRCLLGAFSLKSQSRSILRVWAHQAECVFALRLRRGQQMFALYSKLWGGERALMHLLLKQMRQKLAGGGFKSRDLIVSALGVLSYDWSTHQISDSEIKEHRNDIDYIYKLKEKTLCGKCSKSSRICGCHGRSEGGVERKIFASYDDWKVFIEKQDLVVWRRLHISGNYEYKVYGSYADVTAEDFLNVQIDITYRKQWDSTAVALNVVEADPTPGSNSDIIYWEILWPKLFANRDYVFKRRYLVDYKAKTLYLVSKSTKHPSCPKEHSKYRIEDYWSYMIIKPYTDLNKPGIEFSLTYFDNPGINIPASVTTWVAMKAMPEFLERLRDASRKYRNYCHESGLCRICNIAEATADDDADDNRSQYQWDYFEDEFIDNTIYEAHFKLKEKPVAVTAVPPVADGDIGGVHQMTAAAAVTAAPLPPQQPEGNSFWRYLHPNYYLS